MELTFTVEAIKQLVSESSNEFKAVLGTGVESGNKSNNGKAYADAKKRAKDYDGGLKDEKNWARGDAKYEKPLDGNKTTLDYDLDGEISEETKDRIEAQAEGFTSTLEKKNGIQKDGDREDNKKIYDAIKDAGQEMHKAEEVGKASGLAARYVKDQYKDAFKANEMYESKEGHDMRNLIENFKKNTEMPASVIKEERTLKTVYFKKTAFLNESHMLSRIPDEFKQEGAQFKMKDRNENEYIVEWRNNRGNVLKHFDKGAVNESLSKFKKLSEYEVSDSRTERSYRINEGESAFADTLEKARRIIK